jgi:hypothetical protein
MILFFAFIFIIASTFEFLFVIKYFSYFSFLLFLFPVKSFLQNNFISFKDKDLSCEGRILFTDRAA